MIEFENPYVLLLIIPAWALLLWGHKSFLYSKIYSLRNPMARVVRPRKLKRRRLGTLALKLAVSALLVISLSGPYLIRTKVVEKELTSELEQVLKAGRPAVVICLDVSGSMADPFPGGVKIQVAKEVINRFLDLIPEGVDVGLIAFSHSVVEEVAPTEDRSLVREALAKLKAEGGTMYTYPLTSALNYLMAYRVLNLSTMVIFVTDGMPGDQYRPLLQKFVKWGVPIYTVYIGSGQGASETEFMASKTGGRMFTAESADELRAIFQDLVKEAKKLKVKSQVRLKFRKEVKVREPLSWMFSSLAALLFLALSFKRYQISKLTP